jgi:hypothetical protein
VRDYDLYISNMKQGDQLFEIPQLVALGNYLECTIVVLSGKKNKKYFEKKTINFFFLDHSTRPYTIKFAGSDKCFVLSIIGGRLLFPFLTKPELDNIIRDELGIDALMNKEDEDLIKNDEDDDDDFNL